MYTPDDEFTMFGADYCQDRLVSIGWVLISKDGRELLQEPVYQANQYGRYRNVMFTSSL